jgi:cell division protein FtsI (penicillin-binding protein 3)
MTFLPHAADPLRPALAAAWRRGVAAVWSLEAGFRRVRDRDRLVDDRKLRIFLVLCLFALGFAFMGVEAARKAVFSKSSVGLDVPPPAFARAELTDRNGSLLAVDLPHYGLYLNPREVWNRAETRRGLIAALPRLSVERLNKALQSNRREYLAGALTPQERDAVHSVGLPGVSFEEEAKRVYPLGQQAAHLIGFTDIGGAGLAGAERALDPQIRAAAAGGGSVSLAMDLRVQGALENELRKGLAEFNAKGAVGIVTDVHTGEVLALSSLPDFDPGRPGTADPAAMVNRAGSSTYEMGSTFKMFTVATGLDSGAVTLDSSFDVSQPLVVGGSRPINDFHPTKGSLNITQIFDLSSNIGTGKLALAVGADTMTRYFRSMGLFSAAPIELAESARPILPANWAPATLARVAFGQGMNVTPFSMAAATGALMNGGVYMPLTIVKPADGAQPAGRRVLSETTSRHMLDLMRDNVVNPRGSGGKADVWGLRVGGKTGSAQKAGKGGYKGTNAVVTSFAAVFPTDGPMTAKRYMVLILMDEPQATPKTYGFRTAGWNSTVVAARVIDRIAPFLGVDRVATIPAPPKPVGPVTVDPSGEEG